VKSSTSVVPVSKVEKATDPQVKRENSDNIKDMFASSRKKETAKKADKDIKKEWVA